MASIASKNLYDLLGNDPEQDPDREPEPPTKAIDKPVPRTGKRNAGPEAPAPAPVAGRGRGGSRGGVSGNDGAFRDRNAGSANNRSHAPDDGLRGDDRRGGRGGDDNYRGRGRGRGFGGRGGGRGARDDRHSKTGVGEHVKQAGHGWGYETGTAELNDEKAGEVIAKEEEKEGFDSSVPPPVNAEGETWAPEPTAGGDGAWAPEATAGEPEPEAEPEIKTKSYDEYLAEVAQKKLDIAESLKVRKPNEGASKKFPEGKAFSRDEEENFIAGTGGKAKRDREKKQKEVMDMSDIDPRSYLAQEPGQAGGGRGGRGRGRGDRGGDRGDRADRGDRGDRPDRGDRSDRGDFRGRGRGRGGDRGRGDRDRGDFRGSPRNAGGGRTGGPGQPIKVDDTNAFPSLGS